MIAWTVKRMAVSCGYCRAIIPAGDPVADLAVSKRHRCQNCAEASFGVTVDWTEIANERWRLEQDEARTQGHAQRSVVDGPIYRHHPHRAPVPLSALTGSLFDPKSAAAGDRDE